MRSHILRTSSVAVLGCLLAAGSSGAQAQQIFSAVQSEFQGDGPADTQTSSTTGALLSTTYGGADTRALTDFGVNKIRASGNADYEQYATSAWLDSFTVGGAAGSKVAVSFTFSVDGMASFQGDEAEFNFNIYALRGNGWSMSSTDMTPSHYGPGTSGDTHERLMLTQTNPTRIVQADMRDFDGFWNFASNGGEPGAPQGRANYNAAADYYSSETMQNGPGGMRLIENRFYKTGFQQFANGVPITPFISYSAANPQLAAARAGFENSYSMLDQAQLCAGDGCLGGLYPGSDLTLSFELAAGSTFTLATFLYADDLTEGMIDFFNTAKVSGVTVSAGGTLASQSGALTMQPNGTYGYPAAAPGVPEPATWAMLIGGFGLIGAAARRRTSASVTYA